MKTTALFLAIIVGICTSTIAQVDTIYNQVDSNGNKHGFWKSNMHENGSTYLYAIESYKNGERNGRNVYYYSNGTKREEREYSNGVLNGISKVYGVYGVIQYEEIYNNGKLSGIKKFYDVEGQLKEEQQYTNGAKTGVYHLYSKENKLLVESYYLNGVENGVRKVYNLKGKHEVLKEFDFKNGVRIAAREYKSGNLIKEVKYDYLEELKKNEELVKKNQAIDR